MSDECAQCALHLRWEIDSVNRKLALRRKIEPFRLISWSNCSELDFEAMQMLLDECVELTSAMPIETLVGYGVN